MEFLKKSCSESSEVMCDWCKENLTRVPRPYPNYEADGFHYLSAENSTDLKRSVDDFQPRAQLRKLFQMGKITSSDEKGVESFSKTYIVPNELIKKQLKHWEALQLVKTKRAVIKRKAKAVTQSRASAMAGNTMMQQVSDESSSESSLSSEDEEEEVVLDIIGSQSSCSSSSHEEDEHVFPFQDLSVSSRGRVRRHKDDRLYAYF